ncbi:hypothetical protein MalM25_14970 [Planctomycetes bacterium MalM25]|nr:hypothetical protein MalM25_14970 [Planctomycetes bacterium MalM25]
MPVKNCTSAIVPATKLNDYLLNPAHPVGGPKARWFLARGFHASKPELLRDALLAIVRSSEDFTEEMTLYGAKHLVRGELECPDDSRRSILTIWITETGAAAPRLVTAYPTR